MISQYKKDIPPYCILRIEQENDSNNEDIPTTNYDSK
jgi:hypothetical protein